MEHSLEEVRDLAEESGYGLLGTARIVYGLLTAGVVDVMASPGDQEAH
jgi:hypothetical protein